MALRPLQRVRQLRPCAVGCDPYGWRAGLGYHTGRGSLDLRHLQRRVASASSSRLSNALTRITGLKVCAYGECHELTHNKYCHRHRDVGRTRQTSRWKRVRLVVLREHPICERCGRDYSMEVNHIVPLERGGAEFDQDNLEAVCVACHRKITAAQARGEE